jgi:hypothetical protein
MFRFTDPATDKQASALLKQAQAEYPDVPPELLSYAVVATMLSEKKSHQQGSTKKHGSKHK